MSELLLAVEWSNIATAIGTAVVVLGTTLLTIRNNVTSHWKDSAAALEKHLEITLEEKSQLEQERDTQRQLKHDALTEAAALRAKTDLEPILRALTEVQQSLVRQRQDDHENGTSLTTTLEKINDSLTELTVGMKQLLAERRRS